MSMQTKGMAANSSNQASQPKACLKLRPPREWKVFKPMVERYREIKRWGMSIECMNKDEYPHITKIVEELSEKANLMMPKLYIEKNCFISSSSMDFFRERLAVFGLEQHIGENSLANIANLKEKEKISLAIDGEQYFVQRWDGRINMHEKICQYNAGAWLAEKNQGCIGFTNGFLDSKASENEIRAVIGHELGHLKEKHSKVYRAIPGFRISMRTVENAFQFLLPMWLVSAAIDTTHKAGAALVGAGVWIGYILARGVVKNFVGRLHELQATRFSVKLNGQIGEAVKTWHQRNETNPAHSRHGNPRAGRLSSLLLDGRIYMILHAVFPEAMRNARLLISTGLNIDAFKKEMKRLNPPQTLSIEAEERIRALKEGESAAIAVGKWRYSVVLENNRLKMYKENPWHIIELAIGKYADLGSENKGSTRMERCAGKAAQFVFDNHPSRKREQEAIENAELEFMKDYLA